MVNIKEIHISDLMRKHIPELESMLLENNITAYEPDDKGSMIIAYINYSIRNGIKIVGTGILEINRKTSIFGLIRIHNCFQSCCDIFVMKSIIESCRLRHGDHIKCHVIVNYESKCPIMCKEILAVNSLTPSKVLRRPLFEDLTATYPNEAIELEHKTNSPTYNQSMRIIQLIAPLGRGGRFLIAAPPHCGKTELLFAYASTIKDNPKYKCFVLLVAERPEEVTGVQEIIGYDNVFYSTFDDTPMKQVKTADLLSHHMKRLVECGEHVVLLLDSITRCTRAFNAVVQSSGKVMTGGIEPQSFVNMKKIFGLGRNTKEKGSLTIVATALIDTKNNTDSVIYQELKGTATGELVLDANTAQSRVYPAINIIEGGVRKWENLFSNSMVKKMTNLQDMVHAVTRHQGNIKGMKFLIEMINRTRSNEEILDKDG